MSIDSNGIDPTTVSTARYKDRVAKTPYYDSVVSAVQDSSAWRDGATILDVGAFDSEVLLKLKKEAKKTLSFHHSTRHWHIKTTAIDISRVPICADENIQGDFRSWTDTRKFSCVLCLQVLEHLVNPGDFFLALLDRVEVGGVLIVSVPYMWGIGCCDEHVQDPVDLAKFSAWLPPGVVPDQLRVVRDYHTPFRRLIAVFQYNLLAADPQITERLK